MTLPVPISTTTTTGFVNVFPLFLLNFNLQLFVALHFLFVESALFGRCLQSGLSYDLSLGAVFLRVISRDPQIVPTLVIVIMHLLRGNRIFRIVNQFRFLRFGRSMRCRSRRNAVFVHIEVGSVLAGGCVHFELGLRHLVGMIERASHKFYVRMHLPAFEQMSGHGRGLHPVRFIVRTFQQRPISHWGGHFLSFKNFSSTFVLNQLAAIP